MQLGNPKARLLLALPLLLSTFFLAFLFAAPTNAQTQNGSIDISGIVPGPPPSAPPTIDSPTQNATFSEKNIPVSGRCTADLIVKIFRNGTFAGSAFCQTDATYSLRIDLTEGRNDLIAVQYDTLDQPSPESDTVTVFFVPPAQQPSLPGESPASPPGTVPPVVAKFPVVISYDYTPNVVFAKQPLQLALHYAGGTPPYAISINWGDGTSTILSRENAGRVVVEHTYENPGAYQVILKVSDKNDETARLEFALLVNGQPSLGLPLTGTFFKDSQQLLTIPALLTLVFAIILSFIAGMFFDKLRTKNKNKPDRKKQDK